MGSITEDTKLAAAEMFRGHAGAEAPELLSALPLKRCLVLSPGS